MRRLRLPPPDKETVERIVKIYRAWWRKQDQELAEKWCWTARAGRAAASEPGAVS
jgi:hypothetical protein